MTATTPITRAHAVAADVLDAARAAATVYVGRRPIFDRDRRTVAYELRHRTIDATGTEHDGHQTGDGSGSAELVESALLHWGLDELVGGRPAHLAMDATFLASGLHLSLPADRVVLDLHDDVDLDHESRALAATARSLGYRLAIGDVIHRPDPVSPEMLEMADVVKVDIASMPADDLHATLQTLRQLAPRATVLAGNVDELHDFRMCASLGFDCFEGAFFAKPDVLARSARPVDSLAAIALLVEVQRADIDMRRLESLIVADPTLTYRLLTLVNSGLIGLTRTVDSVYHAVVLLGIERVRQLATLVTMSSRSKGTEEVVLLASTRAGMARRLVDRDDLRHSAATVGLLSLLDVVFRVPMAEVVAEMPLAPVVAEALEHGTGVLGLLMRAIDAYERVDLSALERLRPGELTRFITVYRESAAEAQRLRAQLTG
jgi:EAL and modified HD-GYP domain-containing signal transduction protein